MMAGRPKNPKYARNKNVLIVGGSGSGKTRFWLKPNLIAEYIRQIKDPHHFRCGKFTVTARFAKNGVTLEDCLQSLSCVLESVKSHVANVVSLESVISRRSKCVL